jgi:hypothetical protein
MQDINLQKDYEMALMLERQESTSNDFILAQMYERQQSEAIKFQFKSIIPIYIIFQYNIKFYSKYF